MRSLLFGPALLLITITARAAEPGDQWVKDLRERWASQMDEFNVPGMAVAIVKDGRLLPIETLGVRGPAGAHVSGAVTPDTMFYLASITKTYLATAVCALADDGKLSLDDPVRKYLPRFKLAIAPDESAAKIRVRDLLSHGAGLVDGQPIVVLDAFTGEITDDRYYKWLNLMRLRGATAYSNVHFTLLGRVVEAVSGQTWREYLDTRVLKPAGLARTTGYASRLYGDADCALPMERIDGGWRVCRQRKTDNTMHAAGGLGATARDAARYLMLHLNDGTIDGKRIISAGRAKEMRTLQSPLEQKQGSIRVIEGFGLGWQVGSFHGTLLCSHGGGYAGTATYYAMLPEKKCAFAVLMNAGGSAMGLLDVVAVDILDRLIDDDDRVDVLNTYRKRLTEQKPRMAAQLARRQAEMSKPLTLSQPAVAYSGSFKSADLGTLKVAAKGESLKVALGECELDVAPAGPDAFKVLGPTLDGGIFKFVVAPGGEVSSVICEATSQAVVFQR